MTSVANGNSTSCASGAVEESAELEADVAEMNGLLSRCTSGRVKGALLPWVSVVRDRVVKMGKLGRDAVCMEAQPFAQKEKCNTDKPIGEDVEADWAEMNALLMRCARPRIRRLLLPWVSEAKERLSRKTPPAGCEMGTDLAAEAVADHAEMESLLSRHCTSQRLRHVLDSWLNDTLQRSLTIDTICGQETTASMVAAPRPLSSEAPAAATSTSPGEPSTQVPLVLIVGGGDVATSAAMSLARALVGGSNTDADAANDFVDATVETKYYSARVRIRVLDADAADAASVGAELVTAAEAIFAIWDSQRGGNDSFIRLRQLLDAALGPVTDDDEDAGGERVLMGVAATGLDCYGTTPRVVATEAEAEDSEAEAMAWCAERGFEHLACSLNAEDLEVVASRISRAKTGSFGGLLQDHTDESAERIVESLECHEWQGLERRSIAGVKSSGVLDFDPPPRDDIKAASVSSATNKKDTLPVLAVVAAIGDKGAGVASIAAADGLVEAIADGSGDGKEAILQTKYYSAHLRVVAASFGADTLLDSEVSAARGLVIVFDAADDSAFEGACRLLATLRASGDDNACGSRTIQDQRLRLCVAVQSGGIVEGKADCCNGPANAEERCAELGFELVRCCLGTEELQAVRKRWREANGSGGTPLLGDGEGPCRIVDAIECHNWPGLVLRDRTSGNSAGAKDSAATASAPATAAMTADASSTRSEIVKAVATTTSSAGGGSAEDTAKVREADVDVMERYAEEMKRVRCIDDEAVRRERAAEVAMRLAGAFGLDDEDEDE
eukprot:TRINITY_DN69769_c0_g1_i1.p1 TRINITY_DN69769_c0_g1~~TRINITY_DN69769_c0_g1_i1.p1  ORF type:complete len:785 (+),score=178.07 TRINITY_DN69769_c0_g1_i1:148-2502(+)